MSQNKFTTNANPTLAAVSNADGETPVYLYADPTSHALLVSTGFSIAGYDYYSLTQNSTQDIYTYKTGGSGGTTVATITFTFTDSGKQVISSVAKT